MRMREALKGLITSLGWEPESDSAAGLVSQLSRMVKVTDGSIEVEAPPRYACMADGVGYESLQLAMASGRSIKLLEDAGAISIPYGMTVTIDLNGHAISAQGTAVSNSGDLTIRGGTIESTNSFAVISNSGAKTSVERCVVKSVEGAVITGKSVGTKVSVTGCEMYASDNAVVAGNGSPGFGGNRIAISNSILRGQITTEGYVACGIYCPTDDDISANGCLIEVTGGCGVLSRAGNVTIRDTVVRCTGDTTGKVGDSRVVVPCAALVFDEEAEYPALSKDDRIKALGCTLQCEGPKTVGGRIDVR